MFSNKNFPASLQARFQSDQEIREIQNARTKTYQAWARARADRANYSENAARQYFNDMLEDATHTQQDPTEVFATYIISNDRMRNVSPARTRFLQACGFKKKQLRRCIETLADYINASAKLYQPTEQEKWETENAEYESRMIIINKTYLKKDITPEPFNDLVRQNIEYFSVQKNPAYACASFVDVDGFEQKAMAFREIVLGSPPLLFVNVNETDAFGASDARMTPTLSLKWPDATEYFLKAMIQYQPGHYVAYVRASNGWFCFNDATRTEISEDKILKLRNCTFFCYEKNQEYCANPGEGFDNIGDTCFALALTQVLRHAPEVIRSVRANKDITSSLNNTELFTLWNERDLNPYTSEEQTLLNAFRTRAIPFEININAPVSVIQLRAENLGDAPLEYEIRSVQEKNAGQQNTLPNTRVFSLNNNPGTEQYTLDEVRNMQSGSGFSWSVMRSIVRSLKSAEHSWFVSLITGEPLSLERLAPSYKKNAQFFYGIHEYSENSWMLYEFALATGIVTLFSPGRRAHDPKTISAEQYFAQLQDMCVAARGVQFQGVTEARDIPHTARSSEESVYVLMYINFLTCYRVIPYARWIFTEDDYLPFCISAVNQAFDLSNKEKNILYIKYNVTELYRRKRTEDGWKWFTIILSNGAEAEVERAERKILKAAQNGTLFITTLVISLAVISRVRVRPPPNTRSWKTFLNAQFDDVFLKNVLYVSVRAPFIIALDKTGVLAENNSWFQQLKNVPSYLAHIFSEGGTEKLKKVLEIFNEIFRIRNYRVGKIKKNPVAPTQVSFDAYEKKLARETGATTTRSGRISTQPRNLKDFILDNVIPKIPNIEENKLAFTECQPFLSRLAAARSVPLTTTRTSFMFNPAQENITLSEALERLRWAAEIIPRETGIFDQAIHEYCASVLGATDDAEEAEEDEEDNEESKENVPFQGVLPAQLTVGIRAFKPPARQFGFYLGIRTYSMSPNKINPREIEWRSRFIGENAQPSQARLVTVPDTWRPPQKPRRWPTGALVDAEIIRRNGDAHEIMSALGRGEIEKLPSDILSYMNESGIAGSGQILLAFGFISTLVRGRLMLRAILGAGPRGAMLFERLVSGEPIVGQTRPIDLYVPFSSCGQIERPVQYASSDTQYQISAPFVALYSDALGSDAIGMTAVQYVDNIFRPESDRLYVQNLLPQMYGSIAENWRLDIISTEYPVWNPFACSYHDKKKSFRMLESRAGFVGAVKNENGVARGYVLGEYKTLMELKKPSGRVPAAEHVTQAIAHAFLLYLCTGLRVEFAVIIYSTRRYATDTKGPRAYAATIDLRFLDNETNTLARRDALWGFCSKLCFAPFEPAAQKFQKFSTIYADAAFIGRTEQQIDKENILTMDDATISADAAIPEITQMFRAFFKLPDNRPTAPVTQNKNTRREDISRFIETNTEPLPADIFLSDFKTALRVPGFNVREKTFFICALKTLNENYYAYKECDEYGCSKILPPTLNDDGGGAENEDETRVKIKSTIERQTLTRWDPVQERAVVRPDILSTVSSALINKTALKTGAVSYAIPSRGVAARDFYLRNQREFSNLDSSNREQLVNARKRTALENAITKQANVIQIFYADILPTNTQTFFDNLLLRMPEFLGRPITDSRTSRAYLPDTFLPGTTAPLMETVTTTDVIKRTIERLINTLIQDIFLPTPNAQATHYNNSFIHNSQRVYWKPEILDFAKEKLLLFVSKAISEEIENQYRL